MTSSIELRHLSEQTLLIKKTKCNQNAIAPAFARAIQSVASCVKSSEAKILSVPYGVYLDWRATDCHLAAGFRVSGNISLDDGCEWLTLAAATHVFASHFGPYDKLKETHAAIMAWCQENGKTINGPCWETYPVDPGAEPDPAKWQTDVFYPVA